MAVEDDYGNRTLVNWSAQSPTISQMTKRWVPDNPVFAGAEVWLVRVQHADPDVAAIEAFTRAGFSDVSVLARAQGNPEAMKVLDAHPDAVAHSVMVEGMQDGMSARGIALVAYGKGEDGELVSSVHGFMAPDDVFVALGGFAIPAVQWLQASASPDEDMREDGSLSPQEAVNRLSLFFGVWVLEYVVPMLQMTMQMQLQSIQNMQSWNNAMNACAGDPGCTVTPSSDGSGNWEAVIKNR